MAKIDKTKKGKSTTASPDKLVKAGKEGKVELVEDELKKVSGGWSEETYKT